MTLELDYPEMGFYGWKSVAIYATSGALAMALENPQEGIVFMPGRTDNRSRSPRLTASS